MKRMTALLLGLAVLGGALPGRAEPPADPAKDHLLGPNDGPYLIFVASYRGDDEAMNAQDLARRCVTELRTQYKLLAFMYSRSEQDRAARDRQIAEFKKRYGDEQLVPRVRIVEEWAVFVGHYKDFDAARADLPRIKKLEKPKDLPGTKLFISRTNVPWESKTAEGAKPLQEIKGEAVTFKHAMVARNPLAPKTAGPLTLDEGLLQRYQAFNLSRCNQPFTLGVQGFATVEFLEKQSLTDRIRGGDAVTAARNAALAAAIRLAETLRAANLGHDVYVQPGPDEVWVTVGGFARQNDATDPVLRELKLKLVDLQQRGVNLIQYPIMMPAKK